MKAALVFIGLVTAFLGFLFYGADEQRQTREAADKQRLERSAMSDLSDTIINKSIEVLDKEIRGVISKDNGLIKIRNNAPDWFDETTFVSNNTPYAVKCGDFGVQLYFGTPFISENNMEVFTLSKYEEDLPFDSSSVAAKKLKVILCNRAVSYLQNIFSSAGTDHDRR